ncbi:death on curing protein [Microlunatus sagamiharensis]|uniref:Death on curing protein n=1 Tax=Microlunatus sagamiharensis TaxID=546874 RepID=A0A1H2N577_9ACTN|nr:Fic family protein [Microlunatus sagamiharensis]SDV00398.1 death on curing protein [Microlunatus sagamiharensis]
MTLRIITLRQAILMHEAEGAGLLIDRGKLEGALLAPFATFAGVEAFPSLTGKAAKLLEAVVTAHAFTDGNKRLAWDLCTVFLDLNGQRLVDIPAAEVDRRVRDLEAHRIPREVFALWLSDHLA